MIRPPMSSALAPFVATSSSRARPDWDRIDTVLLDMDGTLLDLQFDNDFWLQRVPERFALRHSLTLEAARLALAPRFEAVHGTLDWYCTDYWSRELDLDIAALKHEMRDRIRYLPGAERFLTEMRQRGLRTVLLTNAHRDSLDIKAARTNLTQYFDAVVSSHQYRAPKEFPEFWSRAQADLQFDSERSLFIDDSLNVLRAAAAFGVAQIFAVAQPDSTAEVRQVPECPSVPAVIDLIDG
jgi:HAD superfamily hydrolase (TIGR01509 family)